MSSGLIIYVVVLVAMAGVFVWYTDIHKKETKKTDFSDILNKKWSVYHGGGAAEIQSIEDDLDLQAAVQTWIDLKLESAAFPGKIDYNEYYEKLLEQSLKLNKDQRAVFLIMTLDNEVGNGGFNQYFYNIGPVMAPETIKSLRVVGQDKRADILEKALENYQYVAESHTKAQAAGLPQAQLEAFSETYKDNPLDSVDSEYYKADDDMWKIIAKYIRSHFNEFKN